MSAYRVFIQQPGLAFGDPLGTHAYVYVWREVDHAVLRPDGTWQQVAEGTAPGEPSFTIPSAALEALAEAVDSLRGQPSHARTEAAVLREWLSVEQARVDRLLGGPPAPWDLQPQPGPK